LWCEFYFGSTNRKNDVLIMQTYNWNKLSAAEQVAALQRPETEALDVGIAVAKIISIVKQGGMVFNPKNYWLLLEK